MIRARDPVMSIITGLLLFAHWTAAAATSSPLASAESGTPWVRNFTPAEYGGSSQNWSIVQDPRGVVYVGNVEDGVLEYDGVRWRSIPTDNQTVRSLAVDPDGRVYVGAVGEIGYLAHDTTGRSHYVSLLGRIPEPYRDFTDVWGIAATSHGIYFSAFRQLMRISAQGVRVWRSTNDYHLMFAVGEALYLREAGRGLLRLSGDELVLVPGSERFAHEKIRVMLPWPDPASAGTDSILIGTSTQGWFLYDGTTFQPWVIDADTAIKDAGLYRAIWLSDGTLAVGTLHNGVFILDRQGRLLMQLNKSSGLLDQTIFELLQDRQGGLWLACDNGIARVEVAAPLTYFGDRAGYDGIVISVHRHAGQLYVGTTQGLYRLEAEHPGPARLRRIAGLRGQVWAFVDWGETLIVGGEGGVYAVRAGSAQLIRPSTLTTFSLLRSRHDPTRLFIGMHNGIAALRRVQGQWVDEGVVPDATLEARTLLEARDGRIWLGTPNSGVARLAWPPGVAPRVERFGVEHGLPRGANYVYSVAGDPVFATPGGILQYEESARRFSADPRFAALFAGATRQALPLREDAQGRVWMYSSSNNRTLEETGIALPDGDHVYHWRAIPLPGVAGGSIAAIHSDDDGVIWFGGGAGLFRYDSAQPTPDEPPFTALVRQVLGRDGRVLFGGAGAPAELHLQYAQNALRFEFAAPHLSARPNRFQVRLEGVDEDWSPWSQESYRDYTNLHEGSYQFRVRAMDAFGRVSDEDVYEFSVRPPWTRTWLAYFFYICAALLLLIGSWRWRSAAMSARNAELAQLVAVRTAELRKANAALSELSVTDTLTGLKNRRYLVEHIDTDIAAIRRAQRNPALSETERSHAGLLLLVVDLDHFKQVNDHYGHSAGDRVLQQFSRILQSVCRDTDTAVRWGGEEFLIVARNANRDAGPLLAERIRALTSSHMFLLEDGKTLRRTCSVGFASYPVLPMAPERYSWEDAVKLADQCLYEAKRSGRNVWIGAQATTRAAALTELDDAVDLTALVEHGYLQLRWPSARRASNA